MPLIAYPANVHADDDEVDGGGGGVVVVDMCVCLFV